VHTLLIIKHDICLTSVTIVMKYILLFILLLSKYTSTFCQQYRLNTNNTIGWYHYMGTFKLNNKFSLHTEGQWRRTNFITNWQQGLLRVGLNYTVSKTLLLRIGYALAETYAYGGIPINSMGKQFTEHRTYQMVQHYTKEGRVDIINRIMMEQRFIGKYSNTTLTNEDSYPLINRVRLMTRLNIPINAKSIQAKTLYGIMYNEAMVHFGNNVGNNVFDQNRIGVQLGYVINKQVKLEAGYLNQTLQLARQVNGKNVFQYNNGFLINAVLNF
jgi:hypothetical protein